ncbi:MAG TPA: cysteine desulfurase family protein [Geminicoccaceae bacterium]|nr:cysteine desulfurase family protein [Geminicoccaceae bacterium]
MTAVYLDYNATAPIRPEVIEAMAGAMAAPGNPSSIHGAGRSARARLEAARRAIAAAVGASAEGVVFTSGGTEANDLALAAAQGPVLVSAVEHPSVLDAAPEAVRVPVDRSGVVRLDALADLMDLHRPAVVSLMLANNETGVLQPVADAAALAHRHGALLHVDAVQALGKLPFDLTRLGADLLSLSAHKLGGPPGVGALVIGQGIEIRARQRGGGQEGRRRAGTENLPGIVGFARAVEFAPEADLARVGALRDALEARLLAACPDGAVVVGREVARLPNTSCILMPGVESATQLVHLDLAGIAVSSGSACSSGKVGPSHVLLAMGLPEEAARSAIRVSLGWASTERDIDRFLLSWLELRRRTAARARRVA